jgi:PTH1 family peptidyl-tRNA hydrolase
MLAPESKESKIQLIIGLGNPGQQYEQTRHNAGAWFIEKLLNIANTALLSERKFHSLICKAKLFDNDCYLAVPTTYMNNSGLAVSAIANFYKIPPQAILVAHDEIDLSTGISRFKQGGGHAGHNGLRDIINHLGSSDFVRLRIGVGHPSESKQFTNYVLSCPSVSEKTQIDKAIEEAIDVLPLVLQGNLQQAMNLLHSG